jgi:hypothetical protein
MGGVDGQIQDLALAGRSFAADQETGDPAGNVGDEAVMGEVVGGIPVSRLG